MTLTATIVMVGAAIFLGAITAWVIWEMLQDKIEMRRCSECNKLWANQSTFLCKSCAEMKEIGEALQPKKEPDNSEAADIIR